MLMLQSFHNYRMIPRYILFTFIIVSSLMGCVARRDPYAFYNGRQNFLNQNYGLARVQLMQPAEEGNPEAQYAIGYMYLNGLGTPADNQEALKWITFSAKAGYPSAQEALQMIKPEMDALSYYDNYAVPSAPPASPQYIKKKKRGWHSLRSGKHRTEATKIPTQEEIITQASLDRPSYSEESTSPLSKISLLEENQEQTIMSKPASSYTIQLIGTYDLKNIQRFIKTYQLEKNSRYYATQRDGKTWYNLLYGVYPNSMEAVKKLNQLPDNLKSFNPWVKPMKQVQKEISAKK